MRLIDADALKATFGMKNNCSECGDKWKACHYNRIYHPKMDFCKWIDDAPTVYPEQPKAGRWLPIHGEPIVACSVCRKKYDWDTEAQYYNFCPNCGVKMEGADDRYD